MGVIYKYKLDVLKNLKKYSKKNIENSFYTSLIFFAEQKKVVNSTIAIHILGRRLTFNIINPDNQLEILRRVTKIFYKMSVKSKILFINSCIDAKFDGIIKTLAYRAGQNFIIGRWPSGLLTKNKHSKIGAVFIFNSKHSVFAIKEANKLGIPVIGITNLDYNISKIMYSTFSNNSQGDSLFFNTFILSSSILEGKLFSFIKKGDNLAI